MAFVEFTLFTPENPDTRTFKVLIEADEVCAIEASTSQVKDEITSIYVSAVDMPFLVADEYEDVKAAIYGARSK